MGEGRYDISNSSGVQAGDHNLQVNVTNRLDRRRGWFIVIVVLVTVGLGVSIAGLVADGADPRPDLELSAFAVQQPSAVAGQVFDAGDPATAEPDEVDTTAIDVTVKNNGDAPAVLTGIELTVRYVEQLDDCKQEGGPVGVAAEYLVTLPDGDRATPYTIDKDIRFEVRGGTTDRFTITVGPAWQTVSTHLPLLIVTDVALRQDDGQLMKAGTAAVITQAGEGLANLSGIPVDAADCIAANARLIDAALEIPATRTEEFAELTSRYARLERARARPEQEACATPSNGGSILELCAKRSPSGFEVEMSLLDFPGDDAVVTLDVLSPDGLVDYTYEWTWNAGWQSPADQYQVMYLDAYGPGAKTMSVVFTGLPSVDVLIADELEIAVVSSPGPAAGLPQSTASVALP